MVRNDELAHRKWSIDANKAALIARKFLEQYHSLVIFRSSSLNNGMWDVAMEVGLLHEDVIVVRIDVETGKIQGYDHVLPP